MQPWDKVLKDTATSVAAAVAKAGMSNQLGKVKPAGWFLKDNNIVLFHDTVMRDLMTDMYAYTLELHYGIRQLNPDYLVMIFPMIMPTSSGPESVMLLDIENADRQIITFFKLQDLMDNLSQGRQEVNWRVMGEIDKKTAYKTSIAGPLLDMFGTGNILALPPVLEVPGPIKADIMIA